MTIVKYKALGQEGRDGWFAMVSVEGARATGTLYEPGHQRRGRILRQFSVKVGDTGQFKVGIGASGFQVRFRHRRPVKHIEEALQRRAKLNMDRASAKAVAKIKQGIDALMEKHNTKR